MMNPHKQAPLKQQKAEASRGHPALNHSKQCSWCRNIFLSAKFRQIGKREKKDRK